VPGYGGEIIRFADRRLFMAIGLLKKRRYCVSEEPGKPGFSNAEIGCFGVHFNE